MTRSDPEQRIITYQEGPVGIRFGSVTSVAFRGL